jgi:hypothetical protein
MVVELRELRAADRLDMAAARMAAIKRPATPVGICWTMKVGKMRSAEVKWVGFMP